MTLDSLAKSYTASDRTEALYQHYAQLESEFEVSYLSANTTYRSPVNFVESMQEPRHRWFPYKEGFSPSFVRNFLKKYAHENGKGVVFDPFSGSGTTPIVAAQQGMKGVGFDVSPLTTFVAATKATILTSAELRDFRDELRKFENSNFLDIAPRPLNETVCRYFTPLYLEALLRVKSQIDKIENEKIHNLFKLAFLACIEPFSTHRKAGNGVKKKTRMNFEQLAGAPLQNVREYILSILYRYFEDLQSEHNFLSPQITERSSLDPHGLSAIGDISTVLTSPPYANCFDYSKIYMSELWLGDFFSSREDQKHFRELSVRSHVHSSWEDRNSTLGLPAVDDLIRQHIEAQELWSPRIGAMLSGYFQDLGMFFASIKKNLMPGANLGFVVGNSFYGGVAVSTDLLLAELAKRNGYRVKKIEVYRGVIPSSQQYRIHENNKKYMRESLVIFENEI